MPKVHPQRLIALVVTAAFLGIFPTSGAALSGTVELAGFTLVGQGCPSPDSTTVTLTDQTAADAGTIRIQFPDGQTVFAILGSNGQRSCSVILDVASQLPRVDLRVFLSRMDASLLGATQGSFSVTSRVQVGRRLSAPFTTRLKTDDFTNPDGVVTLAIDRVVASDALVRVGQVIVELEAQTTAASPTTKLGVQGLELRFTAGEGTAG